MDGGESLSAADRAALRHEAAHRQRLDNKRAHFVQAFDYRGLEWRLGIGFDRAGAVREIFLTGPRTDTDLQIAADDECIVTSTALQYGARLENLVRTMNSLGSTGAAEPSLLHVALGHALRFEREHAEIVRDAYGYQPPEKPE